MHERNALSCAALLLTLAAPAFAQDAKPSTAAEDVIQDPMPRSRLASTTPGGSTRTPPSLPAGSPAKAASAGPVAAAGEQVEQAAPTTAVSLNPAMLLLGGIGVEVDHAVGSNVSFFVAPSFIFGDSVFSTNSNVSMTGFGGDVGLRFYTEPHAPRGFWISPHAGLAFVNATAGTLEANATAFAFGGMLGYSWITDSSFYFSLGAGADYTIASVEGRGISNSAKGASLSLRLALGIAQ